LLNGKIFKKIFRIAKYYQMYALIAMALALTLLVVLLRLKVKLGRSMLLSSITLAILLGVSPSEFWHVVVHEWHNKPLNQTTGYLFVTLTLLVISVNVLGAAMKETGVSQRLVPALQGLFRSRRFALAAIPMMMGMLPTPGGIMLSAPMVRDLGDRIGVDRSRLAAINFFFRHQWESVWPLFPAVPLIQSMFGISAFVLISHNMAIMLAGTLGGVIFLLLSGIPPRNRENQSHGRFMNNIRNFTHAFWPIALVAALYAGLNLSPAVTILLAIFIFLILHKVPLNRWATLFKSGAEPDFALLILGALLFKLNLQAGQAIPAVVQLFSEMNVPPYFLIFFLPLLVGFLTGVTMPTVAITFPFLMPFIGTGQETKVELETLAFSGLVCGLLLTPVHLCLALSASYFEAPLVKIVLKLLVPVIFVAAAGILSALLL
jgi:integral membrane protein (TIGR00529 family)